MSITGQVGHIAVAKQTQQLSPNSTSGQFRLVKITGDSLVAGNNPLFAEGEIGMGRDVSDAVPGGFSAAGAVNGNLRARSAGVFLEAAMGSRTTGGGFDTYNVSNDLSWFTLEKKVGSSSPELMVLRYQDCMVNTFNISAPAGALATFSAGIISCNESIYSTSSALIDDTAAGAYPGTVDDLLVFHGGRIMNGANGSTVARDETFQSVEVAVNNNIAADEYTVRPSRFLRSLTEGIRSVEVNMTLVFENPDKYAKYTYGAVGNTSPGYSFYNGALQVILGNFQLTNDTQDGVGSTLGTTIFTPSTPTVATGAQLVQLNIPKLVFTGLPVALSTGRIAVTTTARALKDQASGVDVLTAFVRPNGAGFNY